MANGGGAFNGFPGGTATAASTWKIRSPTGDDPMRTSLGRPDEPCGPRRTPVPATVPSSLPRPGSTFWLKHVIPYGGLRNPIDRA